MTSAQGAEPSIKVHPVKTYRMNQQTEQVHIKISYPVNESTG